MQQSQLPIKKIAVAGLIFFGIIITIVLVQTFLLQTTLEVKLNQNGAGQETRVAVRQADSNAEVASESVKGGKARFRLPPGAYSVIASGDGSETLGFAKLKRFERGQLALSLQKEKAVQKVGSDSLGCDELIQNQLFSYACTRPSAAVRHDNPPDRFVFPVPLNNGAEHQVNTRPYLQGVLARFENHATRYFDYLELTTNQRARLAVPENSPENYTVITDDADSSNPRFILLDPERRFVYAYRNLQDAQPQKVELPKSDGIPAYSLAGNRFTMYAGMPDHASDTEEEEAAHKQIKQSYLYTLDLSQNAARFEQRTLPQGFRANEIRQLNQTTYLVQKLAAAEIYSVRGTNFELTYLVHTPGAVAVGKDGSVLFTKDEGLFRYDPTANQAHRLFSTSRIRVSRTGYSHDGQPLFNGFIEGDSRRKLHSYLVTNSDTSARRWEEFLPYSPSGNLPIIQMDYVGNAIKVQLSLKSFISDRRTGTISHDPAEFETAKQAVLKRLRSDGIDTAITPIHFTR